MANYIGFLRGLLSIEQLSYATGFPISRIRNYQLGLTRPREATLQAFRRQYVKIQTTRLRVSGLPYQQARRLAKGSSVQVNRLIKTLNTITSSYADLQEIDEAIIRDRYARSDKTAEELTDENYAEFVADLRSRKRSKR